jgi:acyl-CoA synthetase (AMP-forming)/AMP-acid ligase II
VLSKLIFDQGVPEHQPVVVTRDQTTTWGELRGHARKVAEISGQLAKRRIGLSLPPIAVSYAAMAALDGLACDTFLMSAHHSLDEAIHLAKKLKLGALVLPDQEGSEARAKVLDFPDEASWSGNSSVTLLTSGSTGEPKAVRHSWQSLARPVRRSTKDFAPRWLLTYQPSLYAGLQVMLQCFADHGTLVVPEREMDPASTAQFMRDSGVQYVSATPSYWRRLLMFADSAVMKGIPLEQITLGGEVVDQPILNKLKSCFPSARVVHIYATSELGRCFSVSDGIAGFPANYLNDPLSDQVELKICDGELLARSPNAMSMYDPYSSHLGTANGWFATGDLVEVTRDRVYFVGRKSDMINVAGSKVHPLEVERVIRGISGVSDVRVFGKASSIAGELVVCEIVPEPNQDAAKLKENVFQACWSQLATYQQPRLVRIVDRIEVSPAGKTLRSKNP